MVAASSSPLSKSDQAFLTAYISLRFNLFALATHSKQPLLALQDWALRPEIQDHIARYRKLETLQHETEITDARSAGIAALREILDITKDPIERRRAAQTLIRVGSEKPLSVGGVGVGPRDKRQSERGRSHRDPINEPPYPEPTSEPESPRSRSSPEGAPQAANRRCQG